MPLTNGTKPGPYEIITAIGAGGMDEAWKACDPRIEGIAAIKTLKMEFSERFESEARAVASLKRSCA